ncbi:MAG: hypothetical protein COA43_13440 [Robiginitomaculum sp.]|nr:MAG: hypothetical protein COA43_13440 [Robiginitomaculum sp.]
MLATIFQELKRWTAVSVYSVNARFADTKLRVLWLPLSNSIFIALLIGLFSKTGQQGLHHFAVYITFGYVTWMFIADTINGGCNIMKSQLTLAAFHSMSITQLFVKNTIERGYVLLINYVFFGIIIFSYGTLFFPIQIILVGLYLLFLLFTGFLLSYCFSILVLYIPDMGRLIGNASRLLFFASPVFWVDHGGEGFRSVLVTYNPVAYYLHLGRQILGVEEASVRVYIILFLITTVLFLLYLILRRIFEKKVWNIQ